ncbi:MAG: hypothetical protein AAFY71_07230 [Bacteroidota bacterium]
MSKKLHIKPSPDDQFKVLGINSEEKIWKLSFALNSALKLNLQRSEKESLDEFEREEKPAQTLFSVEKETLISNESEFLYKDDRSFPKYTVILLASAGRNLPELARPFRYFLFLLYTTREIDVQEWNTIEQSVQAIPSVLTTCDLTHLSELKNILS